MASEQAFFKRIGVRKLLHQQILLNRLPCGIETAQEAYEDGTAWQINAPRAILVCCWKGMVSAFQELEKRDARD
jgi:hypothetical protein